MSSSASFPFVPCREQADADGSVAEDGGARLRTLVDREHAFVWRSLRRLGVPMTDVDDAAQKVFLVAARRLTEIPHGREQAFLFSTAMRVASNERRAERRKRSAGPDALDDMVAPSKSPEDVASDRALLDALLEPLPLDLRSVVILFELEQLTTEEIGQMLDLPPGTVASRIRRARELIEAQMKRMRAQDQQRGVAT